MCLVAQIEAVTFPSDGFLRVLVQLKLVSKGVLRRPGRWVCLSTYGLRRTSRHAVVEWLLDNGSSKLAFNDRLADWSNGSTISDGLLWICVTFFGPLATWKSIITQSNILFRVPFRQEKYSIVVDVLLWGLELIDGRVGWELAIWLDEAASHLHRWAPTDDCTHIAWRISVQRLRVWRLSSYIALVRLFTELSLQIAFFSGSHELHEHTLAISLSRLRELSAGRTWFLNSLWRTITLLAFLCVVKRLHDTKQLHWLSLRW